MNVLGLRNMLSQVVLQRFIIAILITTNASAGQYRASNDLADFTEALMWCRRQTGQWGLPNGISQIEELLQYMKDRKIQSAWLGMKRETMSWRWVNGTNANFTGTNSNHACAVLNTGTDRSVTDVPCSMPHYGFVCQLPHQETSHCPEPHLSQSCFALNNQWAILGCTSRNWYDARFYCQKRGADLAILDTPEKIATVSRHVADRKIASQCSWVYIGLHRERWIYIHPDGGSSAVNITYWNTGQPAANTNQCVEITLTPQQQLVWNVVSCQSHRPIICQNFAIHDTPHVNDVNTSNKTQLSHGKVYKTTTIVVSVIAGVLLITMIIVGVYMYRIITKQKANGTRPNSPERTNEGDGAVDPLLEKNKDQRGKPQGSENSNDAVLAVTAQPDGITVVIYCSQTNLQAISSATSLQPHPYITETSENVKLYVYSKIVEDDILHCNDTRKVLEQLESQKSSIDITLLPGMKFDTETLKKVQNLQKDMVLLSYAKKGYIGDTAAESIAVGTSVTQYGHGDMDMIQSGLLDVICSAKGKSLGVPISPQLSYIISLAANELWKIKSNEENKAILTENQTCHLRQILIDIARLDREGMVFGTHDPSIGFGEIKENIVKSQSDTSMEGGKDKEQKVIKIVLGSSGIDLPSHPKWDKWVVKKLDESKTGDEDKTQHTGTRAAKLLILSLERIGLRPDQVEIYDAHFRQHINTPNWPYFYKMVKICEEKKIDILYITSGLGEPDIDSRELHDLKKSTVILTSYVLLNVNEDIYSDFPSESVISIRRKAESKSVGSTVDYDFDLEEDLAEYRDNIWSGGVACIALIAKILDFIAKNREKDVVEIFRATDAMHAVLKYLCKHDNNEDEIGLLTLDIEDDDLQEAVSKTEKLQKYYWAGKNIPHNNK